MARPLSGLVEHQRDHWNQSRVPVTLPPCSELTLKPLSSSTWIIFSIPWACVPVILNSGLPVQGSQHVTHDSGTNLLPHDSKHQNNEHYRRDEYGFIHMAAKLAFKQLMNKIYLIEDVTANFLEFSLLGEMPRVKK